MGPVQDCMHIWKTFLTSPTAAAAVNLSIEAEEGEEEEEEEEEEEKSAARAVAAEGATVLATLLAKLPDDIRLDVLI